MNRYVNKRILKWVVPVVLVLGLAAAWALWGVNHAPSFTRGPDITVAADGGPYQFGSYGRCPATDSAAAATAFACGRKTQDGCIAWLPDDSPQGSQASGGSRKRGTKLETIAEHLRATRGFAIGVVTTVAFCDATPAAFVSHSVSRLNRPQIGEEIINVVKPEVVIGSGHPGSSRDFSCLGPLRWSALNYRQLRDGSSGYTFVERTAGQDGSAAITAAAASASKLFGLFGSGGDWEPPKPTGDGTCTFKVSAKASENPSLAAAAIAALTVLSKNPKGFFLMVEGGDIDHANHANNYVHLLGAMHQLAEAVKAGEAFVASGSGGLTWNDTLFILTADHSNGFLRFRVPPTRGHLPQTNANGCPADGSVAYGGRWGYSTSGFNSHTNEPVTLYAKGAGAELFEEYMGTQPKSWYQAPAGRIVDDTQIYQVMKRAAAEAGAKHIVLWIGDGMQKASEIAYASYKYGSFSGLPWASWPLTGYCTTWSVNVYNAYAKQRGVRSFKEATFLANPAALAKVGYDPDLGGWKAYPDDREALTAADTPRQFRYFLGGRPPWALSINPNDPKQKVTFLAGNDNPALFSDQPVVKPDGSLRFKPAPGASGSVTVTVVAKDSGGTAFGGVDTSAPQKFVINITPATTPLTATFGMASLDETAHDYGVVNLASAEVVAWTPKLAQVVLLEQEGANYVLLAASGEQASSNPNLGKWSVTESSAFYASGNERKESWIIGRGRYPHLPTDEDTREFIKRIWMDETPTGFAFGKVQ